MRSTLQKWVPQILAAASSVRQAHSDLRAAVYASNVTAEDVNEYFARVRRLGGSADWRPFAATTLAGALSLNRTADDPQTNDYYPEVDATLFLRVASVAQDPSVRGDYGRCMVIVSY